MHDFDKKKKIKKIILITLCSLLGLALIICISAYLVLHSYIKKINYVDINSEDQVFNENLSDYEEFADGEYLYDAEDAAGGTLNDTANPEIKTVNPLGEGDASDSKLIISDPSQEAVSDIAAARNAATVYSDTADQKNETDLIFPDIKTPVKEDKNVLNILLIGSDSRDMKKRGQSDAMIIISINKSARKIIATSLLRDSYVQIQGRKNNRLNIAYIVGGAKLLINTIENNFKIKIDKYASVNFFTFIDIVDAVGGVTIEVTEKELPVVNGYIRDINNLQNTDSEMDCLTKPGVFNLNGKQTLGYCRVRYVGTDFARTARQRKVLETILDKIRNLNARQMNDLLNKVLPQLTTNFTEKEILAQILSLPDYLNYDMESWSIPMRNAYKDRIIRHMEVLVIDFDKNIEELYRKVYGTSD